MPGFNVTYRETQPGSVLRNYSITAQPGATSGTSRGDRQNFSIGTNVNVTWSNFWSTSMSFNPPSASEARC